MTPTEQQDPPMRAPRNDDWIKWTGGECPVKSPETRGVMEFRPGGFFVGPLLDFDWSLVRRTPTRLRRYRITENHEPQEADMTGKTLKELNVKPGDVVRHTAGTIYILALNGEGEWCDASDMGKLENWSHSWRIVSRAPVATPTRADLMAQRAAKAAELADLDAQIAAMPETVRLYWGPHLGVYRIATFGDTHYRDFPLINGIPEGFKPVEGA